MWRIVWHSDEIPDVLGSPDRAAPSAEMEDAAAVLAGLDTIGPIEPVLAAPQADLRRGMAEVPEDASALEADLSGFFHAFAPDRERAEEVQERLEQELGVRVQIEGRPIVRLSSESESLVEAVPVTAGGTPDLTRAQPYLLPDHAGIDAVSSWRVHGGNGLNIKIIDLEWGWNFRHEDLQQGTSGQVVGSTSPSPPPPFIDHGTAVLGVMSADAEPAGVGMMGIAHGATVAGASPMLPDGRWNVEQAIRDAVGLLKPGHVLLLELQTQDGSPYEILDSVFKLLQWATAVQGIYVIEVAGNASRFLDPLGVTRARDSGAIMVGAGGSSVGPFPRARVGISNFGSRLDLQGWGEHVATCGGRALPQSHDLYPHPDASRCYTGSFAGTSSAAAMVAGVVACIAGVIRAAGGAPLPPALMRQLLMDTGKLQENGPNPPGQNIGRLPNLRAALERLGVNLP